MRTNITIYIIIFLFIFTNAISQELIPYRKDKLWGFCNKSKNLIIPCKYSLALMFNGQFAFVKNKNKWGLIDSLGNEIIPLKYSKLVKIDGNIYYGEIKGNIYILNTTGFEKVLHYEMVNYAGEGLFSVRLKEKYGLIDTTGKEILPVENRFFLGFNCGYSLIEGPSEKKYFINSNGERLRINNNFYLRENFNENFAVVQETENVDSKFGYIDRQGKIVIPFIYDYAASFRNGFAYIKKGKKKGFIDKTGREILPAIYDNGMFNPQYKVFIVTLEKKQGVIDSTGKKIIPFEYDEIQSYKNGRAIVINNKKYGVIDTSGKEIMSISYDRILDLNNFYCFTQNGKCGLTDFNGNVIVPCEYHLISGFKCNRAYIEQNKMKGFIDKAGKLIIPCSYESESDFRNSTAWVQKNHKYGLIDTIGNIIIPFKYDGIFEYQLDASEGSVRFITDYVQGDLTMTQVFKKKYFVRKYKHPMCSDQRYFLRRHITRIVPEWNGYVNREGVEYFEDK